MATGADNGGGNEPSQKETTREVAVTGGVYDLCTTCATLCGYANLNLLTGYTASEMRIGIQCDEDDGKETATTEKGGQGIESRQ